MWTNFFYLQFRMKNYIILIDHIPFFLIVFVDILRYSIFLLIWFGGAQYRNGFCL